MVGRGAEGGPGVSSHDFWNKILLISYFFLGFYGALFNSQNSLKGNQHPPTPTPINFPKISNPNFDINILLNVDKRSGNYVQDHDPPPHSSHSKCCKLYPGDI